MFHIVSDTMNAVFEVIIIENKPKKSFFAAKKCYLLILVPNMFFCRKW